MLLLNLNNKEFIIIPCIPEILKHVLIKEFQFQTVDLKVVLIGQPLL